MGNLLDNNSQAKPNQNNLHELQYSPPFVTPLGVSSTLPGKTAINQAPTPRTNISYCQRRTTIFKLPKQNF